jgi:flagellar biosynthesis/type III secretory pathway chaperone
MLIEKEEIIAKIAEIEKERSELILNLNAHQIFQGKISKASELINAFSSLESQAGLPALKNLNSLLIDIIQKIQEQNKKNQQFLNKAMHSLKEVKQGFSGKKTYTTYGADGMTRALGR